PPRLPGPNPSPSRARAVRAASRSWPSTRNSPAEGLSARLGRSGSRWGISVAEDVRIEEIALVPDDGRFELGDTFALPALLEEGDRREFSIAFSPDLLGAFQAAVRVEAVRLEDGVETAIGPFVVPVEGEATQADPVVTESWRQGSKVDVLFVMDNSPSVAGDYVIPELIHLFLRRAYPIGADFRVGVTTTGVAYAPINNPTCPGGFNGDEDGRLFPHPNEGRPRFVHAGIDRKSVVETSRANL